MRAAGLVQVALNRFSMWALIWDPSPSMKRPFEYDCRSPATAARCIGSARERHCDRRSQLEPLGVLGGEQQRKEHVVAGLHRPGPVVACGFGAARASGTAVRSGGMPPSTFMTSDASVGDLMATALPPRGSFASAPLR